MIVLNVWFNPQMHRQVEARIHRPGQDKEVEIYTLVSRGTVEEKILNAHGGKERCASAILSGDGDFLSADLNESTLAEGCDKLSE